MGKSLESHNVVLEMFGQIFTVRPDGTIECERQRVSFFQLDMVRIQAGEMFITEKKAELSKDQREMWNAVKRKSDPTRLFQ